MNNYIDMMKMQSSTEDTHEVTTDITAVRERVVSICRSVLAAGIVSTGALVLTTVLKIDNLDYNVLFYVYAVIATLMIIAFIISATIYVVDDCDIEDDTDIVKEVGLAHYENIIMPIANIEITVEYGLGYNDDIEPSVDGDSIDIAI